MKTKRLLLAGVVVLFKASVLISCSTDDHYENEINHAELQAIEKDRTQSPRDRN